MHMEEVECRDRLAAVVTDLLPEGQCLVEEVQRLGLSPRAE